MLGPIRRSDRNPQRPLPRAEDCCECDSPGPQSVNYVAARYGKPYKEAPQAHAQEEAQEASEKDALAAPYSG